MEQTHLTNSRFYMWRTLVALVHADHKILDEERAFFINRFDSIQFTNAQKETLIHELENAQNINDLFEHITDKSDRATLIYFARLLFWCDGEFAAQEDVILSHLREGVLSKLDLARIMDEVNNDVNKTMLEYDKSMESKEKKSAIWSAFSFALESGFWPARIIRDLLK